jgi:uncharacterized protein (TIGR03435 family)
VNANEVFGAPWMTTAKFRIDATLPPGTSKEALQGMLRSLLEERFDLKVHREDRPLKVFELTQAKSGAKLTVAAAAPTADGEPPATSTALRNTPKDADGCPIVPPGVHRMQGSQSGGVNCEVYRKFTMGQLAQSLESALFFVNRQREHVIDRTGLSGEFDFQLRSQRAPQTDQAGAAAVPGGELAGTMMSLEAVGLKLTQVTSVSSVLVVDSARRDPHEN